MAKVMNMPKIGVNMTEAKIVKWVVKEGDQINKGDHILDAETDKAVQEIYSTESGIIAGILADEGEDVLCQTPILLLAEEGEKLEADFLQKYSGMTKENKTLAKETEIEPNHSVFKNDSTEADKNITAASDRIRISPLAKKIAKDMGINVSQLQPAAIGARIVKADVLAYSAKKASQKAEAKKSAAVSTTESEYKSTIPYVGTRKLIGERMTESANTKPSVALTLHTNVEKLIEWRNRLKKEDKTVSYNDMIVMIAARALAEHPIINSRLEEKKIALLNDINIGVAVDTVRGLIVPVIRNADKKGLLDISKEFRAKVEAIRNNSATIEDLTGGTFTISNLGMFEIEQFTPIINPPECCILGLGAIIREPVAGENDEIVIQSRMQLTLVFDHRIVDGAPAAKFLQRVKHLIEWPMGLIE